MTRRGEESNVKTAGGTANRDVLILGGGIAGIQSALLLAEKRHKVYLMDSSPAIGGYFPLLERTFPTNSCGICFMSPRPPAYCPIYENAYHENITVLANCRLHAVSGAAGNFTVGYEVLPRCVDVSRCTMCGRCAEVCPVDVPRELGGGLETRKAAYLPFLQAIPRAYIIDKDHCNGCGECQKACAPGAIDLGETKRSGQLEVGAIVLGFGFEPTPGTIRGEYGFGRYANVLSSIQYERMLSFSGPTRGLSRRLSDGRTIGRLAFIQCVGSRDIACGRGYCSSVCCRIATKQAMISKSRDPNLEVTVFYMDIRAMGKEYEKYYRRSREEYGIRYVRSAISTLRELQKTKNLLIDYGSDDGDVTTEEFDAVVLSVGFAPPRDVRNVAELLGVRLNEYGFCETDEFHPTETSVPGIYVAGAFREPRDIPESVLDACSAAADVSALLDDGESARPPEAVAAEELQPEDEEAPRLGIFVCDKHNLIKQQMDLVRIIGELGYHKDIVRLKRVDFSVMEDGLREVKSLIKEHGLNRIIIAGYRCLEISKYIKRHSGILGASSNVVGLANIGEQCANVHAGDPEAATAKALALVRASIEKARAEVPRMKGKKKLIRRVLVVGGGVAGLSSALSLAKQGVDVTLVEKTAELGGNARLIHYTLRGSDVQTFVTDLVAGVRTHPRIDIHLQAELSRLEGTWGSFSSRVTTPEGEIPVSHGAVIFAVGAREIPPQGYFYGKDPRVVTQRDLEQTIVREEGKARGLATVAMIQCVGCRNDSHPYCSRVCCIHAIKNALKLKELNPAVRVFVFYRDVRTYGFYEKDYLRAREKGVVFIRYEETMEPEVSSADGRLRVSLFEHIVGEEVAIEADLVVLSNGIEPSDNARVAEIAGLKTTDGGFFQEANAKSAPLDAIDRGKFFCGICHSPNLLENVIVQGKAAAARASVLLWEDEAAFADSPAYVNERLCSGCSLCVSACPYGARALDGISSKAIVRADLCKGCGTCAASCPNGASRQEDFRKEAVMREMDRVLA